uniref:Membrane protein n=1 Tax=uncultured bacterium ws020C1 TaxID=1131823 RepID=I1X4K1_9BACT|nr:membrane protein [uncultured bacterium ws020C1]
MDERYLHRALPGAAALGSLLLAAATSCLGGLLLFDVIVGGKPLAPGTAVTIFVAAALTLLFLWLARRYLLGLRNTRGAGRVVVIDQHGRREMSRDEAIRHVTGGGSTDERLAQDLRLQKARATKAEMAIAMRRQLERDVAELVLSVAHDQLAPADVIVELAQRRSDFSPERLQELADWVALGFELAKALGALVARHGSDQTANAQRLGISFPAAEPEFLWRTIGYFARMEG